MVGNLGALALGHLLLFSVAMNIGLLLKLEKEGGIRTFLRGVCRRSTGKAALHKGEASPDDKKVIVLAQGDPTMYESFWRSVGDEATIVIPSWQGISYSSDFSNVCWFMEPEFSRQILRLHRVVGNAATENRHLVVGTGSTQLFQAVIYALSFQNQSDPVDIVSQAPFYASYPLITEFLKPRIYRWAGDADVYGGDGPFIELVTSPNNPDGSIRQAVVNKSGGTLVHDFAYYWPQYTPITYRSNHDITLFSFSKCTGHAGSRIGWALVKNKELAEKMVEFIVLQSIGVSKDSQLRAAKILQVMSERCEYSPSSSLFEFGYHRMARRWELLREAVTQCGVVSLPSFPDAYCRFSKRSFRTQPAFAWLKCEDSIGDCEAFLKEINVLSKGGKHFGTNSSFARVSMLDRDDVMGTFFDRLAAAKRTPLVL